MHFGAERIKIKENLHIICMKSTCFYIPIENWCIYWFIWGGGVPATWCWKSTIIVFISPPRYNAFLNIRLRTLKNKCVNSILGQKQCFKIKKKSSTIQITHLKTYFKLRNFFKMRYHTPSQQRLNPRFV